jgi:hypothetical protein
MATTNDLLKDVCASFLDAYGQNPQASSESIIAFEEAGIIPGLATGSPNSAAVAVEFASTLADALPDISSGVYIRTTRSLSLNYDNMLEGSVPNSQTQAAIFNATKAAARQAYDNSSIGSESGPTSFEPVVAMPANWYDPTQQTNWLHYSYSSGTPAAPPTAPPTSPASGSTPQPPLHIIMPMAPWRFTAVQPAATVIHNAPTAVINRAPTGVINRAPSAMATARPLVETVSLARAIAPVTAPVEKVAIGASLSTFVLPTRFVPVATTPAPAPLQPAFTMSFDYCIVQLTRPWLSGDFLAIPGWYVPGMIEGSYSSGPEPIASALASSTSAPASAPTAATEQPATYGPLTFIPTAFVAIKCLTMNASAIEGSAASTGAVTAFGPFSLVNATGASNALTAPGIQIIGWICGAQPQLPPATDPALIPLSTSSASATVVSGASAS